jgi:hypothetical protein
MDAHILIIGGPRQALRQANVDEQPRRESRAAAIEHPMPLRVVEREANR